MKEDNKTVRKTPWILLVAAGCVCVVCLAALLWYPPLWQTRGFPATEVSFAQLNVDDTVNVNTAAEAQLAVLPGIGPAKARAIIAHREENGFFSTPEDLLAVPGIGPKILEELREHVCF